MQAKTFLDHQKDKASVTADSEIDILLTRMAGTVLEGVILPLIDPAVLLKETNKAITYPII